MINYNTSIPQRGLTHLFDKVNIKSIRKPTNQINWASWTVGTGAVSGYGLNGDGNSRKFDTNPWGDSDIVWDVSDQDAVSDADGGYQGTSYFPIDNTKMYRFSVFVRRKVAGNGTFYNGLYSTPSNVLNRSDGASNGNPYFQYYGWGSFGNVLNDWFLAVGHVFPSGSGTGANHAESGIYDMLGNKILPNVYDFVWAPTTTGALIRSYLFYSTDITTNQQWYQPRVDLCDGDQPTITQLLNNEQNKWKNLVTTNQDIILRSDPVRDSNSLIFDGLDDYGIFRTPIYLGKGNRNWAVNAWVKTTTTVTGTGWGSILSNIDSGPVFSSLCVSSGKIGYWVYQGGWVLKSGVKTVNDNNWHLLSWVQYQNGTMDMYVDGVLDSNIPNTTCVSENPINCIGGSWNAMFPGAIANVSIYNEALTAKDIQQYYFATMRRYP